MDKAEQRGFNHNLSQDFKMPAKNPFRIVDLAAAKEQGSNVTCRTSFEVVPVDFHHRDNAYQAHVFLCEFSGRIDDREYLFRKCYARGCSHNLCPHVSQAVMIANRYLQRDYRLLREAGIDVDDERLFTLEDMLAKFDESFDPAMTIDDYINMAGEGVSVAISVEPEFVPAVEHFANVKNAQTFLNVHFTISCLGQDHNVDRCFACYATEQEEELKTPMARVADARLKELYKRFDDASIDYDRMFFSTPH